MLFLVQLEEKSKPHGEAKQVNIKSYSTEEAAMIFDAQKKLLLFQAMD